MKKLIIIVFMSMLSCVHNVIPNNKKPFSEEKVNHVSSAIAFNQKSFGAKIKELCFYKDENPEQYDLSKSVLSVSSLFVIATMLGIHDISYRNLTHDFFSCKGNGNCLKQNPFRLLWHFFCQ